MRYLLTVSITVLLFTSVFSQISHVDSLKHQLSLLPNGRDKVDIMIQISDRFWDEAKIDSSYVYGLMAADLSRQLDWPLGEAKGLHMTMGYTFLKEHNYIKTLSTCLSGLKVFEKENDSLWVLRSLGALAAIYSASEEFSLAIIYDKKFIELAQIMKNHDKVLEGVYGMADAYMFLGKADSAIIQYQEGFRVTNLHLLPDSNFAKSRSYLGLAKASYLSNDYELALSYLKKAYSYAQNLKSDRNNIKGTIQSVYVDIFSNLNQWDSALNRVRLGVQVGNGFEVGMFDYYTQVQMANVFEHINKDSAIKYYKLANQLRTAFNSHTRSEFNKLAQQEMERQQRIFEEREKLERSRKRNIQYTAIAICLGTFIILFLLYSRSIIGKDKLIRYLGVMLLLIVFEFLNLYLHPFLSHLTADSPLFMLLTMVAIAAILIPTHHHLEHWVSHQLVEKNKRIRLEAAKKTIENLEGARK